MPEFLNHLYVVGTASSVMVALLLSMVIFKFSKSNGHVFKELGFILIAFGLSITANSFLQDYISFNQLRIHSLPEPFLLLIGPLFYFYLAKLNKVSLKFKHYAWHFLPFIFIFSFLSFALTNENYPTLSRTLYLNQVSWLGLVGYIQTWSYYFLCNKALKDYQITLKQSCSSIDKINESWIEQSLFDLLFGYTGISFIYLLNHGIYYLPVHKSLAIVLAVILYLIVYKTLIRPEIFSGQYYRIVNDVAFASDVEVESKQDVDSLSENNKIVSEPAANKKYQKSGLSAQQASQTYIRIQAYMLNEKPYIDPELNLPSLAKALDLSVHHLSQVINHDQNSNFYDFINRYRIDEVKQQLTDRYRAEQSILTLAFAAGFNSKATFNRIFKEQTKQTPSQYRKSSKPI